MSSVPKSTLDSFTQDWNGRKGWAVQNGISVQDFSQVVKYDYNRMTNPEGYGKPMSDTEAFDALASLKAGQNPFTTPGNTTPTILNNPLDAVRNNVQNIVTGLFHAPEQLWDDVDSAIHGHFGRIASLIPGYTDITDMFSSEGRQYLLENPLSDILDIGGYGKLADIAEAGLRNAGAVGAADVLHQIPDNPISIAAKYTANQAIKKSATIAHLAEGTTDTLGKFGQLVSQRNLLRSARALKIQMQKVPFPTSWVNLKPEWAAKGFQGQSVLDKMNDLRSTLTDQQADAVAKVISYSEYNGEVMSPKDFQKSTDPTITPAMKTAAAAMSDTANNLQMAEWLNENALKPVTNPVTGDQGWVKDSRIPEGKKNAGQWAGDNEWDKFMRDLNRKKDANDKANAAFSSIQTTILKSLNHLRNQDAGLPAVLKRSPDEVLSAPGSLTRTANFYRVNADDLFRRMPNGTVRSTFDNRIEALFGAHGNLITLRDNISSLHNASEGNRIADQIKSIKTKLTKLGMPDDPLYRWLRDELNVIGEDTRQASNAWDHMQEAKTAYDKTVKPLDDAKKKLTLKWNTHTQGRYAALVQRKMQEGVSEYFAQHVRAGEIIQLKRLGGKELLPEDIEKMIDDIATKDFSSAELLALIPKSDWKEIQTSAYLAIDDMKAAGYEPIFMTATAPGEAQSIERGGGIPRDLSRYSHRSIEKDRKTILADNQYNGWVAIPKEAMGIYFQHYVATVVDEFITPFAKTDDDFKKLAKESFGARGIQVLDTPEAVVQYARQHHYVPWDPDNPLGLVSKRFVSSAESNATRMWIKEYNLKLMQDTYKEMNTELDKVYDKVMGIYRVGVLYASPRYAAHITLGGGLMAVLRLSKFSDIKMLGDAWRLAHNPDELPVMLSRGPAEQGARGSLVDNPFKADNFLAGSKLAQLMKGGALARGVAKIGHGLEVYKNTLETINLTQRALVYLSHASHATDEELASVADEAARWNMDPHDVIGAHAANKALADMMIMSPIERAVIMRYIMPFWGWTKHVLRYVTTFPMDYPLRASIINTLGQQAVGTESALPDYLFRLLFLGQPNAQGNVTVLDDRQWNPFRDVANYMTWGGIMTNLNPLLAAIGTSAFGMDPVTGGPDLYPELTYDSFYGSSTSVAGQNIGLSLLEQVSPQVDTLVQVAQKTSVLREEAYDNPSKLPYLIADSMGLPWIPYTLNVKQEQIKETSNQYTNVSSAVQRALISNSLAPLQGYSGYLPYSGYQTNKQYLGELINSALAADKSSGLNIPAEDLYALPYSSPYVPEYLVAGQPPDLATQAAGQGPGGEP